MTDFAIIGAGLAGCECALVLASYGYMVTLFEQKPQIRSEAHVSGNYAELVCSNSLRSNSRESGVGLLKREMSLLDSNFMRAASLASVPAGKALAVNREEFSSNLTGWIRSEKNIHIKEKQAGIADGLAAAKTLIVAAGPLASENIVQELLDIAGREQGYFYDAIAPVIWNDSINHEIVFRASRYGNAGEGDYLNCPMDREEYLRFHNALVEGKCCATRDFEKDIFFEGRMPIETLAKRGESTLAFGPMKPVGLIDPRNGLRPHAVLQLRLENVNGDAYNLVGCQTRLLQGEQERVFRLVPGLEHAEFARFGSSHRNTYFNAPNVLEDDLSLGAQPNIFLAGQISGVEGYVESAATGLWLGHYLARREQGVHLPKPPVESALGALLVHLRRPVKKFQPSNIHFGLMPEIAEKTRKKERKGKYADRAEKAFDAWLKENF